MPRRADDFDDRIELHWNRSVEQNAGGMLHERIENPVVPAFVWMARQDGMLRDDRATIAEGSIALWGNAVKHFLGGDGLILGKFLLFACG
jgi:hypothetical protein